MIKNTFKVALAGFVFWSSSSFALEVNFNNYVDPSNNDYTTYFNEGGILGKYVQSTIGGVTGGSLIPSVTASYGNDMAILKDNVSNIAGNTFDVSTSFLYNASLANPFNYNTPLQFFLNPQTDWNHYILAGIRGTGTQLEFALSGYSKDSRNSPHSLFTLSNGHWYNLNISVSNIGDSFGQLLVSGKLSDLGTSGLNTPTLVATDTLNTYDTVFSQDSNIRLGIYSEQFGGTAALDNFSVTPVPEPETYAMFMAGLGLIGFIARRRKNGQA